MIISLYRTRKGGARESCLIYQRSGSIFVQDATSGAGAPAREPCPRLLGPAAHLGTDRAVAQRIAEFVALGYRVLYGFLPSGCLPETRSLLTDHLGVETVPDLRDGVPIRQPGSRSAKRRSAYLLFTVLSSEMK